MFGTTKPRDVKQKSETFGCLTSNHPTSKGSYCKGILKDFLRFRKSRDPEPPKKKRLVFEGWASDSLMGTNPIAKATLGFLMTTRYPPPSLAALDRGLRTQLQERKAGRFHQRRLRA